MHASAEVLGERTITIIGHTVPWVAFPLTSSRVDVLLQLRLRLHSSSTSNPYQFAIPNSHNLRTRIGGIPEAYLRLDRSLDDIQPETVHQFFGLAALQMRRHLPDRLRSIHGRGQVKRPKVNSLNSNEASSPGLEIAMETP